MLKRGIIGATLVLCLAGAARAEVIHYSAVLTGANEVPANDSAGTGQLTADLNTADKTFSYHVSYSRLTGAAVAAHFHGPAAPGVNASVVLPMTTLASPISGQATLTESQIGDLAAGRWYFNIHTKAHPGGEIRGQVVPAQ